MFIIFGSPRSGTTLLKEMLCQHSSLVIPHETDFIIPMAFIVDRIQDIDLGKKLVSEMICSTKDFKASIGRHLSPIEICEIVESSHYSLIGLLEGLYSGVAKKSGALLAGDKSPNDLGFVGILKKTGLFESNIKIIHIVRDPRDIVLSLKSVGWSPEDVENYFPRIWANSNLNLERFGSQGKTPYMLVKYEDLILDPPNELKKICNFLEVGFDFSMCEYSKLGRDLSHLPHHSNLGKEMILERRFAWKRSENLSLTAVCSLQAHDALVKFGYES